MTEKCEQIEIEVDGVKLMVEPSSTDSTILIHINGTYVGDIRPVMDNNIPHIVLFTTSLTQPSNLSRHSYRIDLKE